MKIPQRQESYIWVDLEFSAFETIAPADDWTKSLIKVGGK